MALEDLKFWLLIVTLLLASQLSSGHTAIAIQIDDHPSHSYPRDITYAAPNEFGIERARPIFTQAPPGAIISVGFERSFFDAIMAPHASHLVIVDSDPIILMLARLNTALLKMAARDRSKYLHLRLDATIQDWQAAAKLNSLGPASAFITEDNFKLWQERVRANRDFEPVDLDYTNPDRFGASGQNQDQFHRILKMKIEEFWRLSRAEQRALIKNVTKSKSAFDWTSNPDGGQTLGRANYLHDEAAFQRISEFAINNRITVVAGNLLDNSRLQEIVRAISRV